ncbi:holo-[acyl-carrier-protein] synthase [Candidatus Kaiserbacteria bacterium RIFOXYD1_FULL_47_14]|uniref:Holo-[acyl-carrier-protein] synthase n=1 Tax=Candidatus Kaiserbacteria bacterium RIFOXYD1_FULL_47_14 TaxID=1798533 RepID=A0A1F6G514_9BACT|nr:MAG: holo-[acyl-carrier-protein] synthase [Candidatus Kaiserbacteria bacterium RIFOXYD1_FULL_47_14]
MGKSLQIAGIGIDVVEIADVEDARFKKRFAEYFLMPKEILLIPKGSKRAAFLASRFAVKEAVIKAFPKKLKPHDFIIEKKDVRPCISFSSKEYGRRYTVHISLSHTKHIAVAIAIVIQNGV